jgi:hypothetical protein
LLEIERGIFIKLTTLGVTLRLVTTFILKLLYSLKPLASYLLLTS